MSKVKNTVANKKGEKLGEARAAQTHESIDRATTFILDIETRPDKKSKEIYFSTIRAPRNIKDPEKIKAFIERKKAAYKKVMATDTDYAEIVCVGIKPVGGKAVTYTLKQMVKFFKLNPSFRFITYNGKNFDIPLLIKQGLRKDLNFPYPELKEMCKNWPVDSHVDLLKVVNRNKAKPLDTLLQIYCGVKKKYIDFDKAKVKEFKAHCIEDVTNTEKIYLIFKKAI